MDHVLINGWLSDQLEIHFMPLILTTISLHSLIVSGRHNYPGQKLHPEILFTNCQARVQVLSPDPQLPIVLGMTL